MQNKKDSAQLLGEINSRLQILITIGIISPTLLYSFFKTIGQTEAFSNKISFPLWSLVVFYLLIYILFELVKDILENKHLQRLSRLLLIEIGLCIIPFAVYLDGGDKMSYFVSKIFLAAQFCLLTLPIVLIIPLLLILFFRIFKIKH